MIGSPYYWAFVAAITIGFAVVDLSALSNRDAGHAHSVAVLAYIAGWILIGTLGLATTRTDPASWVFPAAIRVAVFAMVVGGELLADLVRTEQAIVHHESLDAPATAPERRLTEGELQAAEAYDAQWHIESRLRNHDFGALELARAGLGADQTAQQRGGDDESERSARAMFERFVQDAIDELPADLRTQMSNVAIVVEDEPPRHENLLGLYQGVPLTKRGLGYAGALPDKITIFRGPLEREYGTHARGLADEVRRTVWHEVAHHFGISDERLVEIDRY